MSQDHALPENELYDVPQALQARAHISSAQYELLYRESIQQPEQFWGRAAQENLLWQKPFSQVLEWDYHRGHVRWFHDGMINVSENCIDRHLSERGDQCAIIWEGNTPGEVRRITYRELHDMVTRCAAGLRALGVQKGDRVAIYMPMVPEAAAAMLACARIGAVHSVIFAGFSAESVRNRINDCGCKVVLTADEGLRGSKTIALKTVVDSAIQECNTVEHVVVFQRTGAPVPMTAGRDLSWEQLCLERGRLGAPERLNAEDPLFILYTSGSTGKPKGVVHTQAGYLLHATLTHRYVFDYRPGDVYFCAADIGWITGHSYVVYGPLSNGATTLMFESIPTWPDAGRYWDTIARHKVSIFYTAPTAIRTVQKEGPELPKKYDLSSLRILGSVGEPINRDAWRWYHETVGDRRCAVVDTWWQTETGGILITPLPGATRTKPGSATKPFFGVQPCVVDEQGNEIHGNSVKGRLCIKHPWPGQARTVFGDHERFVATYFSQYPGRYFTGDACVRDADGYYWITGRVDDVLNVAGHRLGTAEIESAIVQSGVVAEAAVVGEPHEIKGTGVCAFCILKEKVLADHSTRAAIDEAVRRVIGGIAKPDTIYFVPGLPKTRSGKIMRRILRKIAAGEFSEFGDTSSLGDPSVVEAIVEVARGVRP